MVILKTELSIFAYLTLPSPLRVEGEREDKVLDYAIGF
jgi:hypothetical protein